MKIARWMLLILAVLLLMLGTCSLAAAENNQLTISFHGPKALTPGKPVPVFTTTVISTQSGKISYNVTDAASGIIIYGETKKDVTPGQSVSWCVPYDASGLSEAVPFKRMRVTFTMDGQSCSCDFFYVLEFGQVSAEMPTWYPNNTACSFGPQFREVRPELTDKWYMFTPINLSIQGRQEYELVAGNFYVIGKVYVDVADDRLVVSYEYFYDKQGGTTETVSEFFTFFPNLASVFDVEPEDLEGESFRFGQPISIDEDLRGDTSVLLYVCNRVNYCSYPIDGQRLSRFFINRPDRVALRSEMLTMMRQTER